jgi:hypothetical protein
LPPQCVNKLSGCPSLALHTSRPERQHVLFIPRSPVLWVN